MPLKICTLTGVDEKTGYQKLVQLGQEFPFAEFGILLHLKNAGVKPRYPSMDYINAVTVRHGRNAVHMRPRLALHICGQHAIKAFIDGTSPDISRLSGLFDRIQLNLTAAETNTARLQAAIAARPSQTIITQHNKANTNLSAMLMPANHAILFDESSGNGISPNAWQPPLSGKSCGYAGGLGPDNITEELPKIDHAAQGQDYWIDMEGKLRNEEDWFDPHRARTVLRAVKEFMAPR